MKRLVVYAFLLAACGDNRPGAAIDASVDSSSIDSPMIDSPDIDAMPTPAEAIEAVRNATDETPISLPVIDATVTYLKPMITGANTDNDPVGFVVQVGNTGPGLVVAVDPASFTTLTPPLAVGDVVSFTVTEKDTFGMSPHATMITDLTRTATATDIAPLVQDITAVANLSSMIGDYEAELVDVTAATIVDAFGTSGGGFNRAHITTAGVTTIDMNLQLRLPIAFKDALIASADLEVGCVVAVHRTPVNRFNAQFQVAAYNTTDLTVTSCPTPTVVGASATDRTHVTVTFTRNIDMATVMADGSQFTIVDDATTPNTLAVTAAALTGPRTITLTTADQGVGTNYTVTVANTVEDVLGAAIGTPSTATFTGFVVPIPTVMMATATAATTVNVTFTRNIDMASVMADGSQFAIVDNATPTPNVLAVSAASVSGMVVTLTTAAQTPGTMYTVTVLNTVTDTSGTPVGVPNTAMFNGFTPAAAVNHLVINEVDYDMTGTDANEYIEILNPTAAAISLAGKRVILLNGNSTTAPASVYTTIDLTGAGSLDAGEYLVIGSSTLIATVPGTEKTLAFAMDTNQVQNGPRDGVALVDVGNAGMSIPPTLIDLVYYAGVPAMNTMYDAMGQNLEIVPEGASSSMVDADNTVTGALCRSPNGADTDVNATDFMFCATSTPGAANTL